MRRGSDSDRVVVVVAVIEHAKGFGRLAAKQRERMGYAAKICERDQHAKKLVGASSNPVSLTQARTEIKCILDDPIKNVTT